jgi:prepilin-type N-terminal cleavage/methylation domain-containing protein
MLQKLNKKLSRSNKGFSLVELMVAVAILALAALAIFNAFTNAFQAMADARYRTVATNIAQQKLEAVKNSIGIAYPYYNIDTQVVGGITYTTIVVTNSLDDNLEEVYVTVSWDDRNNEEKNVQLRTHIYDLKTFIEDQPDVGRIELSFNPSDIICCIEEETATVTAEVFDTSDPEQRVPSGTPVGFSVDNGSVSPQFTVTDTVGRATTELTINGTGPATVTANSGLVTSDPLEVTCTTIPYAIELSSNPSTIIPYDSNNPEAGGISTITATVKDSCGETVTEEVTVDFETDEGYFDGNSGDDSISITTTDGVVTVKLYMEESGKTATVIGTVTPEGGDSFDDNTTVLCTDYSINITAEPESIFPTGGNPDISNITATLTEVGGGSPTGETITFSTTAGSLSETTVDTVDGQASVILSNLSGGDLATITATYTISGGSTISDSATVRCQQYMISMQAEPVIITPNDSSVITVILSDYLGNPAPNRLIEFSTSEGSLSDHSVYTNASGQASTDLSNLSVGDNAVVTASFGLASGSVNVKCNEYILEISANPESITPDDTAQITALLTNYLGDEQNNKTLTFTTDKGQFENGLQEITATTGDGQPDGQAVVTLTLDTVGVATVEVEYEDAEDTVEVTCTDTYIALTDPPNINHWTYSYIDDSVIFDLDLFGGPLVIDSVNIEWEKNYSGWPSRYRQIWIRIPGGSWTQIFDMGYPDRLNYNVETLNINSPYTISANTKGFRILVIFSYTIRNKKVTFTLNPNDPNAENYQVEFYTPN